MPARDEHGNTPFLHACCKGDAECIAELVRAGCNNTAKNNYVCTGLMLAAYSGSAAVGRRRAGGEGRAWMHRLPPRVPRGRHHGQGQQRRDRVAAGGLLPGALRQCRRCLALGNAQLEERDEHGHTFLSASLKGDAECIAELVKAGCDTAAKNNLDQTALMLATDSSAEAVQAMLALAMRSLRPTRRWLQ